MNKTQIIIDRFEGDYAICEMPDGSFADVPSALLSALEAKEGDVIDICRNDEETARRKGNIENLLDDLFS